ncbi:thioredoxin family protein [Streptomyces sp. NPDC005760]|uniref:thioredoxin family protein n=1 Tax=Streptomyces sp. NPDC005760 TaxID=3156718 RepID=UPI0033F81D5C
MNTNTHTPAPRPAPSRWRRLCRTAAVALVVTLAAAPYASASPATSRPAIQEATAGAAQQAGIEAPSVRAGGAVIEVTSTEQFAELLHSEPRVVAMFTAHWCTPCRSITPEFEYLSTQHGTVTFLSVDVDTNYELAQDIGITSMPTFIAFRNADRAGQFIGPHRELLRQMVQGLAAS